MLPFCIVNCYKSWHRYVFTISVPIAILISKTFHHAVRNGLLCLDFDEDTKKKIIIKIKSFGLLVRISFKTHY